MQFPELTIGCLHARTAIVQGGMGIGVSLSGLAAAVANEGGIGVISAAGIGLMGLSGKDIALAHREALSDEIRRAKELTDGIVGVNIMVALTNFAEMVTTAIKEGIDIIFSGAGLPLDMPRYRPEGSHTQLAPIVSSARAAAILCRKWLARHGCVPDAVVVEGPKAGGHLGFRPEQLDDPEFALEKLVPLVVEAVRPYEDKVGRAIPVIAAGGCFTGADIFDIMQLGASAAQLGTRFVATEECDAAPAFKQAFVDARPEDITVITSPVGMPGRALAGSFLEEAAAGQRKPTACPYHCITTCNQVDSPYCIAKALLHAQQGRFKHGFAFAGSNAHRVTDIVTVKHLMDELRAGYIEAAAKAGLPDPA